MHEENLLSRLEKLKKKYGDWIMEDEIMRRINPARIGYFRNMKEYCELANLALDEFERENE